jgi:hypothetical protein
MIEFILSFVVLMLVVAGMAIGVMNGREPIAGSCGGLNNVGIDGACEICGGDPQKCENDTPSRAGGEFYDAADR